MDWTVYQVKILGLFIMLMPYRKYGIFRLSDPGGIKTIQKCSLRGFHPHDTPTDGKPIYESCAHVLLSEGLQYQVADLR